MVSCLSRSASSGLWLASMRRRPAVGDSAQPFPSEASAQPVWLSHSVLSFHILDVGASDCLSLKGSFLGTVKLESLMSSAVHTATLPWLPPEATTTVSLSLCSLVTPESLQDGAGTRVVLSFQAPGPPAYEQEGPKHLLYLYSG